MPRYDMVVKRGRVLLPGGAVTECDLAIHDGPIAAIGAPGSITKGSIAVGKDADLACIDLDASWVADSTKMQSDAGFSIYDGWEFKGKVAHTMVRGRFAFRDGALCDDALGSGRFLQRRLPGAQTG